MEARGRQYPATDTRDPAFLDRRAFSPPAARRLQSQLPHHRHSSARLPPRPGLSSPLRPGFFRALATVRRADYRPSAIHVAVDSAAEFHGPRPAARLEIEWFFKPAAAAAGTPARPVCGPAAGSAILPVFWGLFSTPAAGSQPALATSPGGPKNGTIYVVRMTDFWSSRHLFVGRTRSG